MVFLQPRKYYYAPNNNLYTYYILGIEMISNGKNTQQHQRFRNQIRRKEVELLKKSKRQILSERHAAKDLRDLYSQIFVKPQSIYQHPQKYLTMLREALNSQCVGNYKNNLQLVFEVIAKFYYQTKEIEQYSELFVQCTACIYYQISIDSQITDLAIRICLYQLDRSKNNSDTLRNRCLVALQNITATQNPLVSSIAINRGVLNQLETLVTDYPVSNQDKSHILSIFGNLIPLVLQTLNPQNSYYFDKILTLCYSENDDREILQKSIELYIYLIDRQVYNVPVLIIEMQQIFFLSATYHKYLSKSQQLCLQMAKQLNINKHLFAQSTVAETIVQKLNELLIVITLQFNANYNLQTLIKANHQIILTNLLYYGDCSGDSDGQEVTLNKNLCICQVMMDNWVEMEDQCNENVERALLMFVDRVVRQDSLLKQIIYEDSQGNIRRNCMNISILEAIVQFMKGVTLSQPEKMLKFVQIMNVPQLCMHISNDYRQSIMQKIEQCIYTSSQQISNIASSAMKLNQNLLNSEMI